MARYLFGDSEPFPESYDFLASLRSFTTCASQCLGLVHQADELERSLDDQAQANLRAIEALRAYFAGLGEVIAERAYRSGAPDVVGPYANALVQHVEGVAAQARAARGQDLDTSALRATNEIREMRDEMRGALAAWLVTEPLPTTSWALSLELGGTSPHGSAIISHAGEITTAFSIDVSRDPAWSRSRRIGDLVSGLAVQVGFKKAFLRSSLHPDLAVLDDFVLSALEIGPDSAEIHLRRKLDATRDSYVITVDPGDDGRAIARVARFEGRAEDGTPYQSSDDDVVRLEALVNVLRRECRTLLAAKRRLLWVQLDGHDIFEQQLVPALFARIAHRLAPIAMEIERRSPSKAELSLKVENETGRREEIYLRKSDLATLMSPLPTDYRGMFQGIAFFDAPTSPSVAPPPPTSPSAAPPARVSGPPPDAKNVPPLRPAPLPLTRPKS